MTTYCSGVCARASTAKPTSAKASHDQSHLCADMCRSSSWKPARGAGLARRGAWRLAIQVAVHRGLEVDEPRIRRDVLEREDLRGPEASDAVLPVDPEEEIGE